MKVCNVMCKVQKPINVLEREDDIMLSTIKSLKDTDRFIDERIGDPMVSLIVAWEKRLLLMMVSITPYGKSLV